MEGMQRAGCGVRGMWSFPALSEGVTSQHFVPFNNLEAPITGKFSMQYYSMKNRVGHKIETHDV